MKPRKRTLSDKRNSALEVVHFPQTDPLGIHRLGAELAGIKYNRGLGSERAISAIHGHHRGVGSRVWIRSSDLHDLQRQRD